MSQTMFGRAKTFIQDWMEDKQITKRLEGKYREDARMSHIREEKAYNEYVSETRTENKIAAQSWQSDLGEGYMADIANGQRQNDLVDRMTSMESGRLPGTTPTFEPRSSLEAAWNPQTGTFQSAAVQFALEAPSDVSHEEFAKSHQTERIDGKIDAPEQKAFEFGENEHLSDADADREWMDQEEWEHTYGSTSGNDYAEAYADVAGDATLSWRLENESPIDILNDVKRQSHQKVFGAQSHDNEPDYEAMCEQRALKDPSPAFKGWTQTEVNEFRDMEAEENDMER